MSETRVDGSWSDLETKGYLVVRGFLDEDSLAYFRAAYDCGPRPDRYFIGLKPLDAQAVDTLAVARSATDSGIDSSDRECAGLL